MTWTTHIRTEDAEIIYTGDITGADIVAAKRAFFDDPASRDLRYVLCDFTAVTGFNVKPPDVQRLIEQDRQSVQTHPHLAEVVVAPQPHAFGLARMWEQQVDDARPRTRVVHSRAEAEAWLHNEGMA